MKKVVIGILMCVISFATNASEITYKKSIWGNKYFIDGEQVIPGFGGFGSGKLADAVSVNDEAYREIKKSEPIYMASLVMAFTGGYMVGNSLFNESSNQTDTGTGAALIVGALLLNKVSDKYVVKAIDNYNAGSDSAVYSLEFGINSISLSFNF